MRLAFAAALCCGLAVPQLAGAQQNFRSVCQIRTLCPDMQRGGGRAIACLREHKAQLSVACKLAIADFFLNKPGRGGAGGGGEGGGGGGRRGLGPDGGGGPDGPRGGGGPDGPRGGGGPDGPRGGGGGPEGPDGLDGGGPDGPGGGGPDGPGPGGPDGPDRGPPPR